ncbi:hypothetical protein J3R82DRAFT_10214 [Butyriboletus roseoflavus]|nr:hypothetical protein J3R82DRAFT_10214 [Butyriboletus roseoflavus]
MKASAAPVLVVSFSRSLGLLVGSAKLTCMRGPSRLVAALTLLQNYIPVHIIDREPHYPIGQRGSRLWPRTFEVFHFLRAHEIHQRATPVLPIREYKPGTLEPTKTFSIFTHNDPTPSNNQMFLGQPPLEGILRSHLEKYGCSIELGIELQSLKKMEMESEYSQSWSRGRTARRSTFEVSYLIGADGAKGVTRKQLGLTFLGETRQDFHSVVGERSKASREKTLALLWRQIVQLVSINLSVFMLRPSDEIAPDGFQFLMTLKEYDPKQPIADGKLLLKCIAELMGHEIHVRKIVFLSEYR